MAEAAISSALSLGAKLLPFIDESAEIKKDVTRLMRALERIMESLRGTEAIDIREVVVKFWLKEVQAVAYEAEDVLDGYYYEVLRAKAEAAGGATAANPCKRKFVEILGKGKNKIENINAKFSAIQSERLLLHLHIPGDDRQRQEYPTSDIVVEQKIFGREQEKEELINLIFSDCHAAGVVSVLAVVGMGGIGKNPWCNLLMTTKEFDKSFMKSGGFVYQRILVLKG